MLALTLSDAQICENTWGSMGNTDPNSSLTALIAASCQDSPAFIFSATGTSRDLLVPFDIT